MMLCALSMIVMGGHQELELVHLSAQRKHILLDTLCALFPPSHLDTGTLGGVTKRLRLS